MGSWLTLLVVGALTAAWMTAIANRRTRRRRDRVESALAEYHRASRH